MSSRWLRPLKISLAALRARAASSSCLACGRPNTHKNVHPCKINNCRAFCCHVKLWSGNVHMKITLSNIMTLFSEPFENNIVVCRLINNTFANFVFFLPSSLVIVGYIMSKYCCNRHCFFWTPVCSPELRLMNRTDTSLSSDSQFTSCPWSIWKHYKNWHLMPL